MKTVVCAVKDLASNKFAAPSFLPSPAYAMRAFADEVNRADPNNMLHKHPKDFEMWQLGTFDEDSGQFDQSEVGRIARGADVHLQSE